MLFKLKITIKLKIFLLIFILIVTLMIAFSYISFISFKNIMQKEFITKGMLIIENFSLNSIEGIIIEDTNSLYKSIDNLSTIEDIIFACVYDDKGYPLIDINNNLISPGVKKTNNLKIEKIVIGDKKIPALDFLSPVFDNEDEYIGCTRIIITLDRVNQEISKLIFTEFQWIFLVFSFIGVIGAYLIGYKISMPIQKLIGTIVEMVGNENNKGKLVQTIKSGKLTKRVEVKSNDEIGKLAVAFNNIMDLLKNSLENLEKEVIERKNVEEMVRKINEDLEIRVKNRTKKLEETQKQLLISEKMAALGQLIAGIAHEINTPLGAIRSSIGSISKVLYHVLKELPVFFKSLSEVDQNYFFMLFERSLQHNLNLSSKEERKFKKALIDKLEENKIENAVSIADTLVDMRIFDNINHFISIFKSKDNLHILEMAYKISGLQRNTETITTAIERASKVVFALKNYARYDNKDEKIPANVIESIETVLTLYYNKMKHGVEVIKNYSEVPEIICYPDELNQVWTNIIHNALQAMEYKGILEISVFMQENTAVITITDNGPGIPEEIKSRIFEPFFTTKQKGEGSGLGLDIVKRIIEKHEGKIIVDSIPGKTAFSIILPILKIEKKG